MAHIKDNEYPYHGWGRDYPLVSFPDPRDGLDFPEQSIYWVHPADQPAHDPLTQQVVEGDPELVDGQWQQTWRIEPLPPAPVPEAVSRAQGKAALVQAGLYTMVQDYVAGIPDPTDRALADIALNDTQEWRRDSPFLRDAADALGLTQPDLDDLFRQAATIHL